jgi:hypothetical protein
MLRVRLGSVAVDVDHGQLVKGSLQDCPLVIRLHALAPVGRENSESIISVVAVMSGSLFRRRESEA